MNITDFFKIVAALTVRFKLTFDGSEYQVVIYNGPDNYYHSHIELNVVNGDCSVQIYHKPTDTYVSSKDVDTILEWLN